MANPFVQAGLEGKPADFGLALPLPQTFVHNKLSYRKSCEHYKDGQHIGVIYRSVYGNRRLLVLFEAPESDK